MLCPRCKTDKPMESYYVSHSAKGDWCKKCTSVASLKWQKENSDRVNARKRAAYAKDPQKHNERGKKYRLAHPEKASETSKNWRKENTEKYLADSRRNKAAAINELKNVYVLQVLHMKKAPQELIELKRATLQITRLLREKKE